jgi:hypothetical protein
VVFILILLFIIGYYTQLKSNGSYLWDTYRRYELGKDLYAKYRDLSISLGIKDEKKQKSMECIVDKWILAIGHSLKSTSAKLLNRGETIYRVAFNEKSSNFFSNDDEKKYNSLVLSIRLFS